MTFQAQPGARTNHIIDAQTILYIQKNCDKHWNKKEQARLSMLHGSKRPKLIRIYFNKFYPIEVKNYFSYVFLIPNIKLYISFINYNHKNLGFKKIDILIRISTFSVSNENPIWTSCDWMWVTIIMIHISLQVTLNMMPMTV